MTAPLTAYTGARIFDGHDLLTGHAPVSYTHLTLPTTPYV